MSEEIMGILTIVAILLAMTIIKRLIMKSNLEKAKAFLKAIEDAEIDARFGERKER